MPLKLIVLGLVIAAVLVMVRLWRGYSQDRLDAAMAPKGLPDILGDFLELCLVVMLALAAIVALVLVLWVVISGLHYFWTHPLF